MKKLIQTVLTLTFLVSVIGCGPSITVTDVWKAPDINSVKSETILVMARMDDQVSRQRFEQEIASQLRNEGMDAVESYKKYPSLNLNEEMSEAQINKQIGQFKRDSFEAIVLTVIKDVKTEIKTTQSGGYVTGGYYPSAYDYYGGFGDYYGSYYAPYSVGGTYVPLSQRTYESDIYKLETVIYDLDRDRNRQLIAVVSLDITDPSSASGVAGPYAKKVLDQFKK